MIKQVRMRTTYKLDPLEDTNPVIRAGELGVDTETGLMKVGDGSTRWDDLEPIPVSTTDSIDGGTP